MSNEAHLRGFLDAFIWRITLCKSLRPSTTGIYYNSLRSQAFRYIRYADGGEELYEHREKGQNVINGDATDRDFWERFQLGQIRAVMLTLPGKTEDQNVAQHLRRWGFTGIISAAARYEEHAAELEASGVDFAYNYYADAGEAFALAVCVKYLEVEEET